MKAQDLLKRIKEVAAQSHIEEELDSFNGENDTGFVIEDAVECVEDAYEAGDQKGRVEFARELLTLIGEV